MRLTKLDRVTNLNDIMETRCLKMLKLTGLLVSIFLLTLLSDAAKAQTIGDYRSNATNFNWSATASWQRWNGVTWVSNPTEGYPGQNLTGLALTVTIQTGHTVTVNVSPALSIGNLSLNGSGRVDFNAGFTLNATGALTLDGTSQVTGSNTSSVLNVASFSIPVSATNTNTTTITLAISGTTTIAGKLTVGNTLLTATGATGISGNLTLSANTNLKKFIGAVTNTGSWTSTAISSAGNLEFRNGVSSNGSATFAAGGATFTTNTQSIGGSGDKSFASSVIVSINTSFTGSGAISFANTVSISTGVTLTNNASDVVTMSNTGIALTGVGTYTQGANSTLVYAGSSVGVTNFNASNTGNTVNYTGAAATIRTSPVIYYHLTYSGSGTGTVATAQVTGDLTVSSGTFSCTSNIFFQGTADQNINGSGTFSFASITLSASSGVNVLVNTGGNIPVSSNISFTANNLLVLDASSNVVLSSTASITGYSNVRYIQLDGSTSSGSQLTRTTDNTTGPWKFFFPIGTATGGYSPLDLTGATITNNPTSGSLLAIKAIYGASVTGQMRRQFRLNVSGNTAGTTTFSNGVYYYYNTTASDVSAGDSYTNYTYMWYLSFANGTWLNNQTGNAPGVVSSGSLYKYTVSSTKTLANGTYYFALGNSTAFTNTWYSYQNGSWSDPDIWTLDPSGTTLNNPLNQTPLSGDQVVILSNITVTCDVSGLTLSSTTIQSNATLDLVATTGHNLGTVNGEGLLRISGTAGAVNLPTGTYTDFVASTGGTIEYYASLAGTYTVSATQTTYNNLLFSNSSNTAIIFVTAPTGTINSVANSLLINGSLNVAQTAGTGSVTWQINNNTSTVRYFTITGNLTVSAGGKIKAGTGGSGTTTPHSLTLYGDLVNNGTIQFLDNSDASFASSNTTGAAPATTLQTASLKGNTVNVTLKGTVDQSVACNSQTDFYRLIIDKGTTQQAIAILNSTATYNMRLFGPVNLGSAETVNNYADGPTTTSNNALSIANGILELTGTLTIPILTVPGSCITPYGGGTHCNNYFAIPQSAGLWLNGAGLTINVADASTSSKDDQRLLVGGLLKVTNGTLDCGFSKGINSGAAGVVVVEGGNVKATQVRPTTTSTDNFAYSQTGGTVTIGNVAVGSPSTNNTYARFSIHSVTSTFQMSGGTLEIYNPTSAANGGIEVYAANSNYSVTGGLIKAHIPSNGNDFGIYTTAPFYDLEVYRDGTSATNYATLNLALKVLDDLTLKTSSGPTFNCNNKDLTIGGDLDIQSGTKLNTGIQTTSSGVGANTITFSGSGVQALKHNGTISNLTTVVLGKTTGTVLTLSGASTFPNITTALTLTSGSMDDGGKTITVTGVLTNNATHISTGSGVIYYNNSGASTINGNGGTFGNLTINTNATIALAGAQTVTGDLRLLSTNTTLNIASYALTVGGGIYSNSTTATTFTSAKRIQCLGLRNDGGLTMEAVSGGNVVFPVGTSGVAAYSPITINVTASTVGYITVRPVNSEHPNVTTTSQSLQYYWRVTSSGFSGITAVSHISYTFGSATLLTGTLTTYSPARYDPSTFTWSRRTTSYNATATTIIPNFNTGTGWTGLASDQLDGEYTCGNSAAFSAVKVYYSKTTGNWGSTSTWSNVSVGGADVIATTPCSSCPVVIGDASHAHTVTIDANSEGCGSLYVDATSILDCSTFTGLNFGANTSGTGKIRVNGANFPKGDFLNFIGAGGGTFEWYSTTTTSGYIIPTTGPGPQNLSLNSYYNLLINPFTGHTITFPTTNLTVYGNLTKSGAGTAITDPNRTYTLNGDFDVAAGTFNFATASGTTTVTQTGTLTVFSGATLGVSSVTGTHTYSTTGSIINNGVFNFSTIFNTTFTGTANTSITGTTSGASTTLNNIIVNKGTSSAAVLTVDVAGTLSVPTNNWLTISNGTFNFNKATGTGNSITLTNTATNPYTILSTAKLKVSGGTVGIGYMVATGADDSDLLLNGELEVAGGTVNIGNSSFVKNNDIEYASAGTPTITVSSGTLNVNGSIRRSTAVLSGSLVYNQTGGSVIVAGKNALNSRAVFDIENTGSSFKLKGTGSLSIQKTVSSASFADLYLNPETSDVEASSTIYLGIAGTSQTITVNSAPNIGGLLIYSNTTASLQNSTLTTLGTLTINTTGILNTNSLDVTIGGDLTINGTGVYNGTIGSGNTTTFNGAGTQTGTLSSGSTFLNLTVNKSSGTVSLSGTSPTITNLNILSGTLDVGTLDITVTGDVINNSTETATTGRILLGGTQTTQGISSSNGVFQNLTLTGSAGSKIVTVTGNMTINGTLNFATTSRYLSIGSYQLTFGPSAPTISSAGGTAFIKTNGVSSDLGVIKNWVAGTNTFNYAVGTRTNYTPIVMTLTVTNPGDMTVIPVDDRHPTANTASSEQILNYYWIITRGSSIAYSTTGSHIYAFPSALMGGTGGTLTAGYLDVNSSSPGWITNDATSSATTTSMSFNGGNLASNLPLVSPNNEFHYSVGTVNTLPNPIIPIYSRLADASVSSASGGSWNSANSWTTQSDGLGSAWGAIPFGNYIVILPGATVNADASGKKAFITEIQGNGVLALINGKVGHSLGIIRGTGTLKTTLSTLPAGNYTSFVSAAGGTVEYSGPVGGTLAMNNARTVYNNIAISATTTGSATTITVPALDLTLNGGVTIKSNATFSNSANRNISIGTNWTNSGGTYVTGTGMLTFNGSLASTITGATPFYNVTINKSGNNVTLAGTGPTTINNTLTLTSGNIVSVTTNKLTLPLAATISGGSSSSFIAGPMSKVMASGSTFNYPTGSVSTSNYRPATLANTTASDTWTVEYVGNDPSNQGFTHTKHTSPINKVSMFEYWNISRLGSTAADVTLTYNTGSYLGTDIGTVANLRVVHWNTATSMWEVAPGGGTVSQSGSNITGTVTTTNQTSFSPDTFGSLDADSPLPVQWLAFTGNRVDNSVVLEWATAQERNNDHFEIQRSIDGKTFDKIGSQVAVGNSSTVQRYKFIDGEVLKSATYYYRIKQVDVDGQSDFSKVVVVTGDGKSLQRWAALPNPTSDNTHFHIQIMDESVDVTKSIQIQIISSNGVIVYEGEGQTDQLNKKLDSIMQGLGQGIYIVQVSDGTYRENFRIARM